MTRYRFCLVALVLALLKVSACCGAAAVQGRDYLWIPSQHTTTANVPKQVQSAAHAHSLYGGHWLCFVMQTNQVTSLPAQGIDLTYTLHMPTSGPWLLWNRIGFEFARAPFEWRIDHGSWTNVSNNVLTTNLMELAPWEEIAWLKLGTLQLHAGRHTLEVRIPKPMDKQGRPQRILYGSNVLVLAKPGVFAPNSCYKPGQGRDAPIDQEAVKKVFNLPATSAPGQRAGMALRGPWQIARADENLPPPNVAVPMKQPQPAAQYIWTGIPVPSDKNIARPDMLLAHRLWYRAKVNVPAADAGHSFFLTFPQNNLNTTVYVNGQLCGFERNPFVRFKIDITKAVKAGQINEIWVGIRDAWYGYTNDPDDPMVLRRCFNYPISFFQLGFQKLAYPIWGHPESGILGTPKLTVGGAVWTSHVFVQPSVLQKRLLVNVTLRNTTGSAATGRVVCAAIDAAGHVAKVLPAQKFTLAAGQRQTITVSGDWAKPRLWWPSSPTMYTLRTTVELNGQPEDIAHTPFGFRQWTWAGRNFKLNGVVWHGWADCFAAANPKAWLKFYRSHQERMMRLWGTEWMGLSIQKALDFFDRHGVVVRRSGMLDGERIGYMPLETNPDLQRLYHSKLKMDLLHNWQDQVVAMAKGERNHPSIMIWSIENEWLYINCLNLWGGLMNKFEKVETQVAHAVMKADPTRPVMSDGGGACQDQTLPVCGNHYVAGDWTKWPAIAYEANPTGGGRGRWVWDQKRPRFIGEDLFITGNHPDFSTFGGEAAFTGKEGELPAAGLLIRMAQQGYRWAGYGAWQFWMGQDDADGSEYKYFAPRVVLVKQWNWTFGSGQKVARTVAIFNDTRNPSPITFIWSLNFAGRKVAGESRQYAVAPGSRQTFTVTLPMPQVNRRTEGTFDLALAVHGRQIWTDHKAVSVLNATLTRKLPGIARLNATTFCVYDPRHSVTGFLHRQGIAFRQLSSLRHVPANAHVLLIGGDALTRAQATSSALAAWAAPGRRVIVLEQTHPLRYQALPCQMQPADNTGRVAFIEDGSSPVVAGLRNKDFFTWGRGQVLYHNAYLKSIRGTLSLIECDESLHNTALVEVPDGKGLLLLTQLDVGSNLGTVVVAQRLLENMLNYAVLYKQVFRPTTVVAGPASPLGRAIKAMAIKASWDGDPLEALTAHAGVAIINASPVHLHQLATHLDLVKTFIHGGGWIVLNGLTPAGLADYDRLVGVPQMIRPFGSTSKTITNTGPMAIERVRLAVPQNPLTAGLTAADVSLYSSRRIFPWSAGDFTLPNEFGYVVDIDNVAPFARSHFADFGNIVNGFSMADGWPLIDNFPAHKNGKPFDIRMTLPQPQTIVQFTYQQNLNYSATPAVSLTFNGDRAHRQTFKLAATGAPQTFAVDPPQRATRITLELAPPIPQANKANLYGIDNIWLKARRSARFYQRVKPMLNIGAMVEYPRGAGGFVLCDVNYAAPDQVPGNTIKKRNILAAILRNLQVPFAGGKTLIAGTDLIYTPIRIAHWANQYRNARGWFGDRSHTFKNMPVGAQTMAGVQWNIYEFKTSPVPEAVMLGGRGIPGGLPDHVNGIAVNRKADALFFLQAARIDRRWPVWKQRQRKKYGYQTLARYVVHYADGRTVQIPILSHYNVANYVQKGKPKYLPGAQVAWTMQYADHQNLAVAYSQQWNNPRPNVEITSIDLQRSKNSAGVPVLLALTAARAR